MKNSFRFLSKLVAVSTFLFLISTGIASAATYYLSPSGNDSNACTSASPCFNLNKVWTLIQAGDTVYMKGGTYSYNTQQYLAGKNGTSSNLIKIWAVDGETPIITDSNSYSGQDLIIFEGNYFHWKGIEIANFDKAGDWAAFRSEGGTVGSIFERINYHHNKYGFTLRGNTNNTLILNSDFHHNIDSAQGNADGLDLTFMTNNSNTITVKGCRAWNNSDDGFDLWENNSHVIFENNWAWRNGYLENGQVAPDGDGGGFKLGAANAPNILTRTLKNNLSVGNSKQGFVENNANTKMLFYNNTAVDNPMSSWYIGYWSPNYPKGEVKNNISYTPVATQYQIFGSGFVNTNNNWNGGVTVSSADFVSMDINQLDDPRKADGSLPDVTAYHLASNSDLINAGVNVGLPYAGSFPDIGAFESGGTTPPPPPPSSTFAIGDRVQVQVTSGALNVRATPSSTGTLLGTQANGALGTVTGGPTSSDGYIWWNVNYDTGVDGWSAENYLVETTTPPPSNTPPTANAGSDQTITLPTNGVTLTGTGADTGGSVSSYSWTKVTGTGGTIASSTSATTNITGLTAGTYTFRLTVTDNGGLSASDDVSVVVNSVNTTDTQAPTVPTNLNGVASSTTQINLTWTASTDNVGVMGYRIYRSNTSSGTYSQVATSSTTSYSNTGLTSGTTYFYKVAAYDVAGNASSQSTAKSVATNSPANISPVANAGVDKTITLPTNSVTLTGSGTDSDGTISSFAWTKVSGGSATIVTPSGTSTVVNGLTQGTYTFWLTVTDNGGGTNADSVTVTVNSAPVANITPTANAGSDKTITLPTNSVTLTGSGTDSDGTVASYLWTKISGTGGTITSSTNSSSSFTGLSQGTYTLRLTVSDNMGATAYDDINVTVKASTTSSGTSINVTNAVSYGGAGYYVGQSFGTPADSETVGYISKLRVFENGVELTKSHSAHADISSLGSGRFSHWVDSGGWEALYFSASDNSNPKTNGKTYTYKTDGTAGTGGGGGGTNSSGLPYGGTAPTVPSSTVQAENYDLGGQNVGYYDTTPGNQDYDGVYRSDDVDITDGNTVNDPVIVWIGDGEWMNYTVNVSTAGLYKIQVRTSTVATGKSMKISLDGVEVSTLALPSTTSWESYKTKATSAINISSGLHVIKVHNPVDTYVFDYIKFIKQ